ncbi:MAG: hypothetical protein K2K89_07895 [Ruminococcus sp.]|nr:hypothetical protein [Ruminococcus sp.]
MKIKKILISLMALVIVASQFTGCADSDLNNNVMNSEEIVITAEKTVYDRKGELSKIDWIALQEKTSNSNIREYLDKYFDNHTNVKGIKYGAFYTNKDNNQEGNNTLFTVLGNEYVANTLSTLTNTPNKEIAQYLNKDYADLEESDYTSAMFNGYFELIPDSTPNYFNGGASLSRAEAMALVMRAVTPVGTLEPNTTFEQAVTGTAYDPYTPYASQENTNAYISTADSSLNKDNYAGTMTRAEYVYLVLNEIYGTEQISTADVSKVSLSDCTLNSKIADTLKLTSTSNQYHSACLQYALQTADKGVPDELYQSLATANTKDIISSETRWDEAITKTEAIEILIATMQSYYNDNGYPYNNAEGGTTASLESDAKALWEKQDKNDMSCTEEEFIEDYVTAVGNGSMTPEAFEESIEARYSIKFAEKQAEEDKQVYIDSLWEAYGGDKLTCDKETFTKEYNAYRAEKGDSYSEEDFATYIKEKYGKQETEETTEETEATEETGSSVDNDDNTPDNNSSNNDNSSTGNSGNSGNSSNSSVNNSNTYEEPVYTPPVETPAQQEQVYTPPVDNTPAQQETVYTPPVEQTQQEPVYTPPVDNGGSSNSGGGSSDWEDDLSAFGLGSFNPDLIEMGN